jgi:hypothetical protein
LALKSSPAEHREGVDDNDGVLPVDTWKTAMAH